MSQSKKNKAYVKKLKNGFAIKSLNKNGSENVLIITSDYLEKSSPGLNQKPTSIESQLNTGKAPVGKTSQTSTNSNNPINTVLSHLEPHLSELKPDTAGFHIFKNDTSLSPENIDTSIILVANTKLAREKGVAFNVPAKLVNVRKTICSDSIIANGDPVVKPIMVIVGNYVVHINLCCKIPTEPPTTTIGTQTSVCAEPVFDDYYYHTVTSVKPTISDTINAESSQTLEVYSPRILTQSMSETYPFSECDSILSTAEQHGIEEMSVMQAMESHHIDAISCFQPIQYSLTSNSATQTEYIVTNSVGTSTADMYERGSSAGDSAEDCKTYQNLSTLVVNNSIPDVYQLENKRFKSHEYCHDSNSFDTFSSHYRDLTTNVIVSPDDTSSTKNTMITIFKNSYDNTSNTSFDAEENNKCMLEERSHLNQEEIKQELPLTTTAIGLSQRISSNMSGEEANRTTLRNENHKVYRKEFDTIDSLVTSASTLASTRVSFKNSLYNHSESNDSGTDEVLKYSKHANKLKPNFYSFDFKGCFKKSKNCLEPKHYRYDHLVYSNKIKLFDKNSKHKPNVLVSYTKRKIVYPKFSKSDGTMFLCNMNNQTKNKLKSNKNRYMYCTYTRKNVTKTPTELERVKSNSNPYHLKNNQHCYKTVYNLSNICELETKLGIHYLEVNHPKNMSCMSMTAHSDGYKNKNPIEGCPILNDDKIKMICLEADLSLNNSDHHHGKESDPNFISQPTLMNELNRNVNFSNTSSSRSSLLQVPSHDLQIKEEIITEDKNNKTNIVQIFEEKSTFGTQTSSIHMLPSCHEVQLASDLSSAMQYPLTETNGWPLSDNKDDFSNLCNFPRDSKSEPTLKHNLKKALSFSGQRKINVPPINGSKKDNLENKKSTQKINSFVNYLFSKFKKHNKNNKVIKY